MPKLSAIKLARTMLIGAFLSFLVGFVLISYPVVAIVWNLIFPQTSGELAQVLAQPVTTQAVESLEPESTFVLPPQDPALPAVPTIRIPKIGVNTPILEASLDDYESALIQGVWRVPNFGIPIEEGPPIILVAHRFGYLNWSQAYRETNSFFNLPELQEGDRVEVIWDQRKFEYEIYLSEDGTEISHYSADLILYTCRFLESDIRIFRYARLIQPE